MAYEINWSPEAIEDLQSTADYIAKDSRVYAQSVVAKIFDVSRSLVSYLLIGRIVPEIGELESGSDSFTVIGLFIR